MRKSIILLLCAAILFTACNGVMPHAVKTLTLTSEEQVINTQQNAFAIDLLKQVNATETESENVFLSPLSAAIVSAMLANGAEGNTLNQILATIGAEGYSVNDLNEYYKNILENLPYLDKYTDMKLADGIWIDDDFNVKNDFVKANKQYYEATVETANLADPKMANVINKWAENNTKHLIKKIVSENDFTSETYMILANAIYFMSKWQNEFNKANTQDKDFMLADGTSVLVSMMEQSGERTTTPDADYEQTGFYEYQRIDSTEFEARMLRLYFKEAAYCVDFILPHKDISCDAYLADFDLDKMTELQNNLNRYCLQVMIPKFSLKYHRDLIPDMQALGMTDVFSSQADLTGIADQDLLVSQLVQDTYIKLEEEGVKAAAVTHGIVAPSAAEPGQTISPFVADRPFLLFIRECKYGTILFAGKIGHPETK